MKKQRMIVSFLAVCCMVFAFVNYAFADDTDKILIDNNIGSLSYYSKELIFKRLTFTSKMEQTNNLLRVTGDQVDKSKSSQFIYNIGINYEISVGALGTSLSRETFYPSKFANMFIIYAGAGYGNTFSNISGINSSTIKDEEKGYYSVGAKMNVCIDGILNGIWKPNCNQYNY